MRPRNAAKVLSSVILLAVAAPMSAADRPSGDGLVHVRLGGRFDAGTVQRSLDRFGRSGAEHLGTLLFYDGSEQPRCRAARTLAFTFPGSQIVFVCTRTFVEAARRDPVVADAALIHESLHSLGLGENPPTSSEITSRVISRCRG
jgi:hypothetical protein